MTVKPDIARCKHPKFLLFYSPLQFADGEIAKPDGSLSLAYIAGALRSAGYTVRVVDCSVGDEEDTLEDTFFRPTALPSGLFRVGLSEERILELAAEYDVIGVTSIFTSQTTMVLDLTRLLKKSFPEKLIVAGGVNARSLRKRFFDNGVDIITMSEAENTIVNIADALRRKESLFEVPGIAFRDENGKERINPIGSIVTDLDRLPMPAWDLLPFKKYWDISRPHGGEFQDGTRIEYASLQTSRGCPYQCIYCHISEEKKNHQTGNIGSFRVKSVDRVIAELEELKRLGVKYVFFEDDSLFAKKKRAYQLFEKARELGLSLLDVNGVNICHLQKNNGGNLEIDTEFLEVLGEAGFRCLTLPFESANQRLINKYASSKWNVQTIDIKLLLKALAKANIESSGNYMIGYPDETLDEIKATISMARHHVEEGLAYALFFNVVPYPGSKLFDMVIANGQLDPDFDTDKMRWTKSILKNLALSSDELEEVRQKAWLTVNRKEYVEYKLKMKVSNHDSGEFAGSGAK